MAEKRKPIRFDFFKVVGGVKIERSFSSVIEGVSRIPVANRTIPYEDRHFNIHRLQEHNGTWEGFATKIRTGETAVRASTEGEISPIPMEDNEGIGEMAGFLFDPELHVLMTQRSRFVTPAVVMKALQLLSNVEVGTFALEPILQRDAYRTLARVKTIKSLCVRIARPSITLFADKTTAVRHATELSRFLDAGYIEFTAGADRKASSRLHGGRTKEFVGQLLGLNSLDGEVQKIELRPGEHDIFRDPIDLMSLRLVGDSYVMVTRNRLITFDQIARCMREVWSVNGLACKEIFGVDASSATSAGGSIAGDEASDAAQG